MKCDTTGCIPSFDPPTRMTTDGRHISISIALTGVSEEQIWINLEKTMFTLSVVNAGKMVKKVIPVPQGTRICRKRFTQGVLDISLEKLAA